MRERASGRRRARRAQGAPPALSQGAAPHACAAAALWHCPARRPLSLARPVLLPVLAHARTPHPRPAHLPSPLVSVPPTCIPPNRPRSSNTCVQNQNRGAAREIAAIPGGTRFGAQRPGAQGTAPGGNGMRGKGIGLARGRGAAPAGARAHWKGLWCRSGMHAVRCGEAGGGPRAASRTAWLSSCGAEAAEVAQAAAAHLGRRRRTA